MLRENIMLIQSCKDNYRLRDSGILRLLCVRQQSKRYVLIKMEIKEVLILILLKTFLLKTVTVNILIFYRRNQAIR